MSAITPEQRAEWRTWAEAWTADEDAPAEYAYDARRILALLDALDAAEVAFAELSYDTAENARRADQAEATVARVEALAEKWIGWPDEEDEEDQAFADARRWHGRIVRHVLRGEG